MTTSKPYRRDEPLLSLKVPLSGPARSNSGWACLCWRSPGERNGHLRRRGCARAQPLLQLRPTPPTRDVAHRDSDGLLLSDQHDKLLAAGDAGVKKVPLQHRVMLRHHWDDHGLVFRTLAFVDGRGIRGHQHVEFAKPVGHSSAVKRGGELAVGGIDILDIADIAIIDILFVIVLDLHDLVARRKGPAKTLDLAIAGRIECSL